MTAELLPSPSPQAPARAERPAEGVRPSRTPGDRERGWARPEQDCPYCSGPETD